MRTPHRLDKRANSSATIFSLNLSMLILITTLAFVSIIFFRMVHYYIAFITFSELKSSSKFKKNVDSSYYLFF